MAASSIKVDTRQVIVTSSKASPYFGILNNVGGFKWDDRRWPTQDEQDSNAFLPALWDPSRGGVDYTNFQSGIGDGDDLEYKGLHLVRESNKYLWNPIINHGYYYRYFNERYLYGSESIVDRITVLEDVNGNTVNTYTYELDPKPYVPISANIYVRNDFEGIPVIGTRIRQRVSFTGIYSGETQLETVDGNGDIIWANVDINQNEFVVDRDTKRLIFNKEYIEQIGIDSGGAQTYDEVLQCEYLGEGSAKPDAIFTSKYFPMVPDDARLFMVDKTAGTFEELELLGDISQIGVNKFGAEIDYDTGTVTFSDYPFTGIGGYDVDEELEGDLNTHYRHQHAAWTGDFVARIYSPFIYTETLKINYSSDGGKTWATIVPPADPTDGNLKGVPTCAVADEDSIYMLYSKDNYNGSIFEENIVAHSNNNGATWSYTNVASFFDQSHYSTTLFVGNSKVFVVNPNSGMQIYSADKNPVGTFSKVDDFLFPFDANDKSKASAALAVDDNNYSLAGVISDYSDSWNNSLYVRHKVNGVWGSAIEVHTTIGQASVSTDIHSLYYVRGNGTLQYIYVGASKLGVEDKYGWLFKSTDSGQTWIDVTPEIMQKVLGTGAGEYPAHFSSVLNDNGKYDLYYAKIKNGDSSFNPVDGSPAEVWISKDDGVTWTLSWSTADSEETWQPTGQSSFTYFNFAYAIKSSSDQIIIGLKSDDTGHGALLIEQKSYNSILNDFYITYKKTARIEYEPEFSSDYKIADIDINPLKLGINRGFLFLSENENFLNKIVLSVNKPLISNNIYGPLYTGGDYAVVTAKAFNVSGQPIGNIEVTFSVDAGDYGFINGQQQAVTSITDFKGETSVSINTKSSLESVSEQTSELSTDNKELILDSSVNGWVTPTDVYLFQLRDDDTEMQGGGYRKVIVYTYDANAIDPNKYQDWLEAGSPAEAIDDVNHPYYFKTGGNVPLRPTEISGNRIKYDVALDPIAGNVVGYMATTGKSINISASGINSKYRSSVYANDISLSVKLPSYLTGAFIDSINSFVYYGFRFADEHTFAASSLGTATFLTINPQETSSVGFSFEVNIP